MKMFSDFSDAFDYCREVDRPVVVLVQAEQWNLFPSGRAVEVAITPASPTRPRSGGRGAHEHGALTARLRP
jgi:hypothetical protein